VAEAERLRLTKVPGLDQTLPCVFCSILAGDSQASIVSEDALTVAFLDIRPITRGHTLVVPRRHRPRLGDLDHREAAAMWRAAMRICGAAHEALQASGANVLLADGTSAGQEVDHVHLHVIPRYRPDELVFEVPAWERPAPRQAELGATALALAAALR
jgi:histidine triad (HIT) family protein